MMNSIQQYTPNEFWIDADEVSRQFPYKEYDAILPIPRGGVPLGTYLLAKWGLPCLSLADFAALPNVNKARVIVVDDVIGSGATRALYGNSPFVCLHSKKISSEFPSSPLTYVVHPGVDAWVQYWWESSAEQDIAASVVRQLEYLGEDPNREGLRDTPTRVVKSWKEIYGGYGMDVGSVFRVFSDVSCDQMVLLRDIEFFSTCEHHMLPFFGRAHVAYLPDKKVLGVSKLARLVDIFARRLQIQERIGEQVTDALMQHLAPKGAACVIEAQHFCMKSRGVQKQNSVMTTSSLKGAFLDDSRTRDEFLRLIQK